MSDLEQHANPGFVLQVVGVFDTAAAGEARQLVGTHQG